MKLTRLTPTLYHCHPSPFGDASAEMVSHSVALMGQDASAGMVSRSAALMGQNRPGTNPRATFRKPLRGLSLNGDLAHVAGFAGMQAVGRCFNSQNNYEGAYEQYQ